MSFRGRAGLIRGWRGERLWGGGRIILFSIFNVLVWSMAMEKWIQSISGRIPFTQKDIKIDVDGRNLIITGANGSGKTSLIRAVYEKVNLFIVKKQNLKYLNLEQNIRNAQNNFNMQKEGTAVYDQSKQYLQHLLSQRDTIKTGLEIIIPNLNQCSSDYGNGKSVIFFFEERHFSEITPATAAKGLSEEAEKAKRQPKSQRFGNSLEQHLVNLANRRQWALGKDNDLQKAKEIDDWFSHFEQQLKKLFEDNSVRLEIDSNSLKYRIIQNSKPPYDFQHLSAGYRAIFDIYAELLMRTEYFKIMPSELTGIVFIDEIDSHLHVSLQRLILPFFTESFPKIQFIVTTHSPFVLMSGEDTVVFDLAKNEPITEDLSLYTYSAVMKGLWNVKPIAVSLEENIKQIASIVNSENKDYEKLRELVGRMKKYQDVLDSESKSFFLLGLEILNEENASV